eukprot:10675377-Alexandrium_andersonii.AAC.2
MAGEVSQIRQRIACGLPMVCRGRLGDPTLSHYDETVDVKAPDEFGLRGPLLRAGWTAGYPDQRGDAPPYE